MKGAVGRRWRCFRVTSTTGSLPFAAASSFSRAAEAWSSVTIVNCSTFSPSSCVSLASNALPSLSSAALIVQYSRGSNASISSSRSQIRRSAGDWTRPADSPRFTFFQSSGERLKPTR